MCKSNPHTKIQTKKMSEQPSKKRTREDRDTATIASLCTDGWLGAIIVDFTDTSISIKRFATLDMTHVNTIMERTRKEICIHSQDRGVMVIQFKDETDPVALKKMRKLLDYHPKDTKKTESMDKIQSEIDKIRCGKVCEFMAKCLDIESIPDCLQSGSKDIHIICHVIKAWGAELSEFQKQVNGLVSNICIYTLPASTSVIIKCSLLTNRD
jgi:hypothetical protein